MLWAERNPRDFRSKEGGTYSRTQFRSHATRWLEFIGRLEKLPCPSPGPFSSLVEAFCNYRRQEKGLAEKHIREGRRVVMELLDQFGSPDGSLHGISITGIHELIIRKVALDGYSRKTLQSYVFHVRAFFRFAEMRGLCRKGFATGIKGPRMYADESLPSGPPWEYVLKLLATVEGDQPVDIRDRAILLLLACYGFRAGEITRIRLEDFDWENETVTVTHRKTGRTRKYPLLQPIGLAVWRYLTEVRPKTAHREVFLTLHAPYRPPKPDSLWEVVSKRLRPLGIPLRHYGPHSLRHACAIHLLNEGGRTLKEVGDHLGHIDPDSTRIYAKVNLAGLRQVGDFDLGDLI